LSYSTFDFCSRDNKAHDDGVGDGYLSLKNLRRVIQDEYARYERSPDVNRQIWIKDSEKMQQEMVDKGVDTVDYLPDELNEIDDDLRTRAVELLNESYQLGKVGTVDQTVVDRVWRQYQKRRDDREISRGAVDRARDQLNRIVDHLNKQPDTPRLVPID
jgi:hypothetical protein